MNWRQCRCLLGVLFFCAIISPEALPEEGGIAALEALGWDGRVVLTCALTAGQTFGQLYSDEFFVREMVSGWRDNFLANSPSVMDSQTRLKVWLALQQLCVALQADKQINWTARELFLEKWDDLPASGKGVKSIIRGAFKTLKDSGFTALSFMSRAEDAAASPEYAATLRDMAAHPFFSRMTNTDLYTTPADPVQYNDMDLALLSHALDGIQLVRTEPPGNFAKALGCCDRTTRKCVITTWGNCQLCGSYCCLGSNWCA